MAEAMMPAAGGDGDMGGGGDDAAGPTALLTVMMNADGTFQLMKGDEPEPGMEGEAAQGMAFDAPGPLLKAILDIVQGAQNAGEGSADQNFNDGFSGDATPTPAAKKPMSPAERY